MSKNGASDKSGAATTPSRRRLGSGVWPDRPGPQGQEGE